jgi:hypothetical protein
MELLPYADVLDFDIEHPLTREPLRVDVIIIKKKKNVVIDKNIAVIFRGRNIVEYKSPEDSLTIADFHQDGLRVPVHGADGKCPENTGGIEDVRDGDSGRGI